MADKYKLCESKSPALQAFAFHPTSPSSSHPSTSTCGLGSPVAMIRRRPSAPLNLDIQNALFNKMIFWALPVSEFENQHDRQTWTYLVQLLLTTFDNAIQINGIKEFVIDYELNGIKRSLEDIRTEVSVFKGRHDFSLDSISHFLRVLGSKGLLSKDRVEHQRQWIDVLKENGLQDIVNKDYFWDCAESVVYHPFSVGDKPSKMNAAAMGKLTSLYHSVCANPKSKIHHLPLVNLTTPWVRFPNIALVVLYNHPLDYSIPFVELLYRPFFPIIVHCSPYDGGGRERFEKMIRSFRYIFIESQSYGPTNYECIKLVHALRLPVSGYLFLADDIVLSVHDILKYPQNAPWISKPLEICSVFSDPGKVGFCAGWHHTQFQRKKMMGVFKEWDMIKTKNNNDGSKALIDRCSSRLRELTGSEHNMIAGPGTADIYYLPSKMLTEMTVMVEPFIKHDIFLEVAVPTLLHCLTVDTTSVILPGSKQWYHDSRDEFYRFIPQVVSGEVSFLHPTKWYYVWKGEARYVESYCKTIIPFQHQKLHRSSVVEWWQPSNIHR